MIYGNIKTEIVQCKNCPLYSDLDYGCIPQWGMGNHLAKLLVVNLRSSQESHLIEKPIELKYSLLFKRLLVKAGIKETDVFVTNLIKCRCDLTPAKKFRENAAICKNSWLPKELDALSEVKNIVCFGERTMQLLFDNNKITIEKPLTNEQSSYYGKDVRFTYSFEEIFRKGKKYEEHALLTLEQCKDIINAKVEETR